MTMWSRNGNCWTFLPIPSVTVISVMTSRGPGWAAHVGVGVVCVCGCGDVQEGGRG